MKKTEKELKEEIGNIANEILVQAEQVEMQGAFTDETQLRKWLKRLRALQIVKI